MHTALGLALCAIVGCAVFPGASAQTPAELGIRTCAGLVITGSVGIVYSVESVSDLAQSNNPAAWRCLEYLQLPANPHLWIDKSAPMTGTRFYRALAMEPPPDMVFIPPGTFRMGSPTNEVDRRDSEGPQTAVIVSRGFWMGKCEVTQREYLAVMGFNPSFYQPPLFTADLSRPVEQIDWYEATNYCAMLTRQERAAARIATNSVYRLPTEAEWEYACRAWTSTRLSYGDDPGYTNLTDYAWYFYNSGGTTHPVGQKLANPWGLYDMYGNVLEWCQDGWSDHLQGGIALDPQAPDSDWARVLRGGDWKAVSCRSAARGGTCPWCVPDPDVASFGFRVVLAPGQP